MERAVKTTLYRIEVNTPDGWATLQGTYESREFAIEDAKRELRETRVVAYQRPETVWWRDTDKPVNQPKTDFLMGYKPSICTYCGFPENSRACQRGHP